MKKTLFLYNFILILYIILLSENVLFAQNAAAINVFTSQKNKSVSSKLVNGIFIEFLRGWVNGKGGLWAEELADRGFDLNNCGTWDTLCYWIRWSTKPNPDKIHWMIDETHYNEHGKFSMGISGDTTDNVYGIYQRVYLDDEVSHRFYIYHKTAFVNAYFKIIVFDTLNKNILFESDSIYSQYDWKKTEITIPPLKGYYSCNLLIAVNGKRSIVFDEASLMPSNNVLGMRHEYYNLLSMLKPGIIRYPGGCFADTREADWREAVNPIDQRKSPNLVYNIENQRKDFGTDEIIKICKLLNIEPYFVVNYGSGTAESAANWVEYCNGDTNTVFGKLRASNGYPEPYNVKYWEVGNEQWDNPASYALGYLDYYNKMKAVDSSIKIIINGNCWDTSSFNTLIGTVREKCQIFGYHPAKGIPDYIQGTDRDKYLSMVAEDYSENRILDYSKMIDSYNLKDLKLASTEWWSTYGNQQDWILDTNIRNASLEAALWNSYQLLCYFRNPQVFDFATRTIAMGMIRSGINSSGKKVIYATPSFYALAMISNHSGDSIYTSVFNSGFYFNHDNTNLWVDNSPWLDVTASGKSDTLFLAVINRHPENQFITKINLDCLTKETPGKAYFIKSQNFLDANTVNNPENIIQSDSNFIFTGEFNFPPHSLTILAIPVYFGTKSSVPDTSVNTIDYSFSIVPNPVDNDLNITSNYYLKKGTIIEIYDLLGQVITKYINPEETRYIKLAVPKLNQAIYLVKITDNKHILSKIFIKN